MSVNFLFFKLTSVEYIVLHAIYVYNKKSEEECMETERYQSGLEENKNRNRKEL